MQASGKPAALSSVWRQFWRISVVVVALTGCASNGKPLKVNEDDSTRVTTAQDNLGKHFLQFTEFPCLGNLKCETQKTRTALGRMILVAASKAPSVQKAYADVRRSEQVLKTAKAGFLPSFGVRAESEGGSAGVVTSLSQPLWGAGRLKAAVASAEAELNAARANLAIAQTEVALQLIESHSAWSEALYTEQLLAVSVEEHMEILDAVRRRSEAGVSGASEIAVVEARLASVRSELLSTQASKALAETKLTSLFGGQIPQELLTRSWREEPKEEVNNSDASTVALQTSPYIWLASAEMDRAKAAEATAKADRFPSIAAVAENAQSGFGGVRASNGRVYLGISTNFGPGLSLRNRIAEAVAAQDGIRANQLLREQLIRDEVSLNLQRIAAAQANIDAYENVIVASKQVLDSYRNQMTDSGGKSWQDVLSAARELNDARRKQATSLALKQEIKWRLVILVNGLKGF